MARCASSLIKHSPTSAKKEEAFVKKNKKNPEHTQKKGKLPKGHSGEGGETQWRGPSGEEPTKKEHRQGSRQRLGHRGVKMIWKEERIPCLGSRGKKGDLKVTEWGSVAQGRWEEKAA